MYIPGFSKRSTKTELERRKGGGRGGGKSSGGGGGRRPRPISSSGSNFGFGGRPRRVSAWGGGGGSSSTIPAGQVFAGRSIGGGTRNMIYGTRSYGSGYGAGFLNRGVSGRPFPFYFWPLVWGSGTLWVAGNYLDARAEYGDVNNSTRPGGPLATAIFQSSSGNSTFRVMADNDTVVSLLSDISSDCNPGFSTNPPPVAFFVETNATLPRPEQVIQYYRASSIVLTLDGYNNSATYGAEGAPDTPLPSNTDTTLLSCLNETIGDAAPLVDGGITMFAPSSLNLIGLVWSLWVLLKLV